MTDAIIVALITGTLALLGNMISARSSNKVLAYKLDQLKADFADLRERVNKHNNLVERMAIVEQSAKSAHHRIDDLKKGVI